MPKSLTKELAGVIAYNYYKNGFKNKGKALRDSGYSVSYSRQLGLKIFDNVLVTSAIEKIETLNLINTTLTQQEVMDDLKYGLDLAKINGDLPSIARFAELRGKTLAMFKDKIISEDAEDSPTPEEADRISEERRANIAITKSEAG